LQQGLHRQQTSDIRRYIGPKIGLQTCNDVTMKIGLLQIISQANSTKTWQQN